MPKPSEGESRDHFISRCIPIVIQDGTAEDADQAVAVCQSMWESSKMTVNDRLLAAIQARGRKTTEFGYGIMTADRHVQNVLDAIGLQDCYLLLSDRRSRTSLDDVMKKAAGTLVYSNPDMEVEEKRVSLKGLDLPKNTLMVFHHTLSTSREDRDGDVMHPEGMDVDPKMLLLWQHAHTMPIGKLVKEVKRNSRKLEVVSAIVDLNELSHDAAVMVDNDMARFSHGFRAIDFTERETKDSSSGGFDITRAEIMEESIVSVPANLDAVAGEVLLSLVEGGKMTSPLMKRLGESIREHRQLSLPVNLNIKMTVNGQEVKGVEPGSKAEERVSKGNGPSKEADGVGDEEKRAGNEKASNVKLNAAGSSKAKSLIAAGKVKKPSGWEAPSADDQNKYIEDNGMAAYGKWFLGIREGADEDSKGAYAYPYTSDFKNVDRTGLAAIRQRAGQQKEQDVFDAAGKLIDRIDEEEGKTSISEEKSFYGDLTGSYEWVSNELRSKARAFLMSNEIDLGEHEYVGIVATFLDYVILECGKLSGTLYYKIMWNLVDGKPQFKGTPEKVEINVAVKDTWKLAEKRSRVLSKSNEKGVQEAIEYIKEVLGMEISRVVKSLLQSAAASLVQVMKSTGAGESEEDKQWTVKQCVAKILVDTDLMQRRYIIKQLRALEDREKKDKETMEITHLMCG